MRQLTAIKWLFLDLNSYFASVEQQLRPELRGKPVAIVPMQTDYTCAIAASYEAKAYGIKTGTRILDAKEMCPDLQCVLARHDQYVRYHHKILSEVIWHIPITKVCSIDELSSRIPEGKRNRDDAIRLALKTKEGLRSNVGEYIRCSIGIAPNSFLAKLATDMQKPDGLIILDEKVLPGILFDLKLTDLCGIGDRMEYRLKQKGISTVEQFWKLSPKQARAIWGSVLGERMWYRLHGYDIEDPPTKQSGIGHSRVLDPELRSPEKAWLMARKLTMKAASRLRREEKYSMCFDLSVSTTNNQQWFDYLKTTPLQDNFACLKVLDTLWDKMQSDLNPQRLLSVSVNLRELCKAAEVTPDLFDTTSQGFKKMQTRDASLTFAMDKINRRFGPDSLQIGIVPKTQAGYVGTKISYTRIPDLQEFYE